MHVCISKLNIGSDNGQAFFWTNAGILLIRTLGTNFSEILSEIHIFSFRKLHLKMSSGKWWLFCLSLNVLRLLLHLPGEQLSFDCNKRAKYSWLCQKMYHRVVNCWYHIYKQDRRWNADKPSAALDPYIPTWLTTSPANHTLANFWKSFF